MEAVEEESNSSSPASAEPSQRNRSLRSESREAGATGQRQPTSKANRSSIPCQRSLNVSVSLSGPQSQRSGSLGSQATLSLQPRSGEKSASGIRSKTSSLNRSVSRPSAKPDYSNVQSKVNTRLMGAQAKPQPRRLSASLAGSSPLNTSNTSNRRASLSSNASGTILKDKSSLQVKSRGKGQQAQQESQQAQQESRQAQQESRQAQQESRQAQQESRQAQQESRQRGQQSRQRGQQSRQRGQQSRQRGQQSRQRGQHVQQRDQQVQQQGQARESHPLSAISVAVQCQSTSCIPEIQENPETRQISDNSQNLTLADDESFGPTTDGGRIDLSRANEVSTTQENLEAGEISNSENLTRIEDESFIAPNNEGRTDFSRPNEGLASSYGQESLVSSSPNSKLTFRNTPVSITSISENQEFVTEKPELSPIGTQDRNNGLENKEAIDSVDSESNITSNLAKSATEEATDSSVRPKTHLKVAFPDDDQNETIKFEPEINKSLSLEEIEKFSTDNVLKNSSMICDKTHEDLEGNLKTLVPWITMKEFFEVKLGSGFSEYLKLMEIFLKNKRIFQEAQQLFKSLVAVGDLMIQFSPIKESVTLYISNIERELGEHLCKTNKEISELLTHTELAPVNKSKDKLIPVNKNDLIKLQKSINELVEASGEEFRDEKRTCMASVEESKDKISRQVEGETKKKPSIEHEEEYTFKDHTYPAEATNEHGQKAKEKEKQESSKIVKASDEHLITEEENKPPSEDKKEAYVEEPDLLTNISPELIPWTDENKTNLAPGDEANVENKSTFKVKVTQILELVARNEPDKTKAVEITDVWAAYAKGEKLGTEIAPITVGEPLEESDTLNADQSFADLEESFIIERDEDAFPYISNSKHRSENLKYFSKSDVYEITVRKEEGRSSSAGYDSGATISKILEKFEDYAHNFKEETADFFNSFETSKDISLSVSNLEETTSLDDDSDREEASNRNQDNSAGEVTTIRSQDKGRGETTICNQHNSAREKATLRSQDNSAREAAPTHYQEDSIREETSPLHEEDSAIDVSETSSYPAMTFYINEQGRLHLLCQDHFGEVLNLQRNEERKELLKKILKIAEEKKLDKKTIEISDLTSGNFGKNDFLLLNEVLRESFPTDLKNIPALMKPTLGDIFPPNNDFTFYINERNYVYLLCEQALGKRLLFETTVERKRVLNKILKICKDKKLDKMALELSDFGYYLNQCEFEVLKEVMYDLRIR